MCIIIVVETLDVFVTHVFISFQIQTWLSIDLMERRTGIRTINMLFVQINNQMQFNNIMLIKIEIVCQNL